VVADLPLCDPLGSGMGVAMRGDDEICGSLFSYVDVEDRVRADHPLRIIREIANAALAALSGDFAALYSGMGRPSVKLLRAMLLQAFYSVLGATVDGADRVRPLVPLVRRHRHR
jgi:hypothetical protein